MKNLAIVILVFFAFICAVYSQFKCFKCQGQNNKEYTTKQCEKDQTKVDCPANYTCFKLHGTTTAGLENEARRCTTKSFCDGFLKLCKGTKEEKEKLKIKECEAACCVSDGDTPCNGGFTMSINMIMTMFAVLCTLKIF